MPHLSDRILHLSNGNTVPTFSMYLRLPIRVFKIEPGHHDVNVNTSQKSRGLLVRVSTVLNAIYSQRK
jgi:hypothetical protein